MRKKENEVKKNSALLNEANDMNEAHESNEINEDNDDSQLDE